jgi:hypothetical protein
LSLVSSLSNADEEPDAFEWPADASRPRIDGPREPPPEVPSSTPPRDPLATTPPVVVSELKEPPSSSELFQEDQLSTEDRLTLPSLTSAMPPLNEMAPERRWKLLSEEAGADAEDAIRSDRQSSSARSSQRGSPSRTHPSNAMMVSWWSSAPATAGAAVEAPPAPASRGEVAFRADAGEAM